jgi:hypothetical protein
MRDIRPRLRSHEGKPWLFIFRKSLLLADLRDNPRYAERSKQISALLADPRLPKVEQIYFVPR